MAITVNKVNVYDAIYPFTWSTTIWYWDEGNNRAFFNVLPDYTSSEEGYVWGENRVKLMEDVEADPSGMLQKILNRLAECPYQNGVERFKDNLAKLKMYAKIEEVIKMGNVLIDDLTGEVIDDDDYYVTGDHRIISQSTYDDWFFTCDRCGQIFHQDEEHDVDGNIWCEHCTNENAWWCDYCEEYHSDDESYYEYRGRSYCSCGLEQMDLVYCFDCERVVPSNRFNYSRDCCCSCSGDNALVRPYHDAPSLRWFGIKSRLAKVIMGTGFELEVDDGDDLSGATEFLHDLLGDQVYFEEDGSLSSDGFEIISQPMTDDYMRKTFFPQLDTALRRLANDYGYKSHDADTCGLHFHFSRELWGYGDKRDRALEKFVLFFEDYYNDIVKFSRRTSGQCNDWAKKYIREDDYWSDIKSEKDIKDLCKGKKRSNRYHAVNLTNRYTVEVRIMRGTLNPDTFKASYDFLYTLVKNSKRVKYTDRHNLAEWFKGLQPETIAYMKSRHAFDAYTATV